MTCPFLDNLTLGTLIAPVTENEFRASYWERMPLIVNRKDPEYYGNLLTLQDFDCEIASTPAAVKIAEAKTKKNTRYESKTASLPLETILSDMRSGATLVLDALHKREPKLGLLCRLLEQQLGHPFGTNVYLTPPRGQGFTPHWDNHDVFVLQVMGSKHWKVEKQRRRLPGKQDQMGEEEGRALAADAEAFTLSQGDMVYIPRGCVHAAECGSEPSMHITLGLHACTWEDLLRATITAAVKDDERLRGALPLGFLHDSKDGLVTGAMTALRKIADHTFLGSAVERYRDELVTKFALDISGQVAGYFQGMELNSDDRVGPRAGIVYRINTAGDSVRLAFGGRNITFAGFFGPSLQFALNTPAFAIRDIAGELEEDEKIVFAERLMQEGLLVRK
jgi:ribosomal protein L16 Arg81 hydroxylase